MSPPSDAANRDQAGAKNATSQNLERIAAALESLPQRQDPDAGCQQGKEDRTSDLCAQWKAADAAQASADWTRRTFWLALAGTVIGGLTLGAAAYAAYYAKSAAKAATSALEHEIRVSGLQLNAILHIESVNVTGENSLFPPQVSFDIKNVGTLPAKSLSIIGAWGFRGNLEARPLVLQPCVTPKGISPGGIVRVRLPASEDMTFNRLATLYCQFEVVWEFRSGEQRRIAEIHKSDGENFSFIRDY